MPYFEALRDRYYGRYLFAQYLDQGMRGYKIGMTTLAEIASIVALPLTLSAYGTEYVYDTLKTKLSGFMAYYAGDNVLKAGDEAKPFCTSWIHSIASILVKINDQVNSEEDSLGFLFDNFLMDSMNDLLEAYLAPLLYVPRWMMTVAYISPKMYYDFYFTGKKTS